MRGPLVHKNASLARAAGRTEKEGGTMSMKVGNAPCSWGVDFADDDRNPPWETVLRECAAAGYRGIELGRAAGQ